MELKLHMKGRPGPEPPDMIQLECYTDADFGGDKNVRKSVSGMVIKMNRMIVGWQCTKQGVVALSMAKAGFVAAVCGGQERLGREELLTKIGLRVQLPLTL
ncbi:putative Gag-Pol poly [Phytophthora infestans]|uniref:Putative Gag-Pol poly n=1 Tax=Phytophthora infestans TaxID=4787 RepID=A0A833SHX8_PHYIN|nr:putative Gag-Pol poly [Phytophthora infestans]